MLKQINSPPRMGLRRALANLQQPGAKLMLTFNQYGRVFAILPQGDYVAKKTAQKIIKHPNIRVCDYGLFPDQPQSWVLK